MGCRDGLREDAPRHNCGTEGSGLASLYTVDASELRSQRFFGVSQRGAGLSLTGMQRTPGIHTRDV